MSKDYIIYVAFLVSIHLYMFIYKHESCYNQIDLVKTIILKASCLKQKVRDDF